ncbi:SlyX family protein [Desulforhopalus vacuolatus]|uniref:SlyX family protein n=1 Tax=Desulforhopalus vacuolatus TaxID=40414 RepID=UPI001965C373|nr:SlyX family protein [Desulforhopalus vacuolatus]
MKENDHEQRLQSIEEKISWQEETLEQLSEVLLDHQRQIDKLIEEQEKLLSLTEVGGEKVANEKPPHY